MLKGLFKDDLNNNIRGLLDDSRGSILKISINLQEFQPRYFEIYTNLVTILDYIQRLHSAAHFRTYMLMEEEWKFLRKA